MTEDEPWWYTRCVHRDYPVEQWHVLRETEQVVAIWHILKNIVHILVDTPGVGSKCQHMTRDQYFERGYEDDPTILRYVQAQVKDLKSIRSMY